MRNNRYNLEGERYKGKFKGSRNRKEVTKKEYMWDRKENYFWWEGTGVIFDRQDEERYVFGFSTYGTIYRQPRSVENLIMNFEDNADEEVRKKDRDRLKDCVLGSLVSRIKRAESDFPKLVIMPYSRGRLIREGLIPDENGQLKLGFRYDG